MNTVDKLLTIEELAWELKRNPSYVWGMKRNGFLMPGHRATLNQALEFLKKCPEPRKGEPRKTSLKKNASAEAHGRLKL